MTAVIQKTSLANGLTLIGELHPHSRSASIGFFVRTGARDEFDNEHGLSHFLEHMMFKGTKKRSSMEVTFELGNLGAQANAYTSEENTVYYSSVLPEYLSSMHELLVDMLRPSLDQVEFDSEKKVILEEIALYQDRPQVYLIDNALQDYFQNNTVGNSVLGTTESVSAISRDTMANYFNRRYAPSNMALAVSGNYNWDRFVEDSTSLTAEWVNYQAKRELARFAPRTAYREFYKENLNQAHILLVTEGASAQDPERFALSELTAILGDSSGSKLYWEVVDTGLAESAGIDSDERDGLGAVLAYAATSPENVSQVSERMRKVLSRPLDFTEEELEQVKTKLVTRMVLGGELPMGRLMALGSSWLYREELKPLSDLIRKIQGVTKADIELALQRFPLSTLAEYRLLPK